MAHKTISQISEETLWALEVGKGSSILDDYKVANEAAIHYQNQNMHHMNALIELSKAVKEYLKAADEAELKLKLVRRLVTGY